MNDEIKLASENFSNAQIPDKILKFYEFLDNNKYLLDFLDYETIVNCEKYLKPLLRGNFLSEISVFYVDNSHSCFSIWHHNQSENINNQPIIYNNTEGIYTVCARNLDEFFYLMSFNIIPDLSSSLNYYEMSIRLNLNLNIKSPIETYNEEVLDEIKSNNNKNKDYQLFKSFVKNTLKIKMNENPASIFMKSVNENPNLKQYIRSMDAFIIDPDY